MIPSFDFSKYNFLFEAGYSAKKRKSKTNLIVEGLKFIAVLQEVNHICLISTVYFGKCSGLI